ncbi:AbrB/MazE/SpoVT family DNA-binding domain-containing protein [Blastomonas sp.]|uniref:AbrB/MazE/SpoVT family DNA-binding domain-containing protein n=1 Tax=Blastomonas sp. TaxID=1909299 RepID=UPI00391A5078
MNAIVKLSSKGQIVIPKDIRDELDLHEGEPMRVRRSGRQIILESAAHAEDKISFAEFRRRIPRYAGPPVAIDDMTSKIGTLFKDWEV